MSGILGRLRRLPTLFIALLVLASIPAIILATAPPAAADTLGYPDSAVPCSHAPYLVSGACARYEWGPIRDYQPGYETRTTYSGRGYGYRNCTDYVAWKLESLGISKGLTRGRGNGKNWDDNGAGVTLTKTPEAGDAAVWNSGGGGHGHVAFVEAVRPKAGGGWEVTISEYNKAETGIGGTRSWVQAENYVDFNGVGTPLGGSGGGSGFSNRQILQGPDGGLYVVAGGAKFKFGTMNEFYGLGYSTNGMTSVTQAQLDALPGIPPSKTILVSGGGGVYVVAGGAKFAFGSMTEYYQRGYTDAMQVKVPQGPLDAIGDAPGRLPYDKTVLQQPSGALSVMAGGVKFPFSSMTEYYNQGYTNADIVYVPQNPTAALPTAPAVIPGDGNVLVAPTGAVYVLAGGKKFAFSSMSEYAALGYHDGQIRRVSQAPLDSIPTGSAANPPSNRTVVKATSGAVWVIAGGVKFAFSSMTEYSNLGYNGRTIVTLATDKLNLFGAVPAVIPPDGTVLKGTSATVYLIQGRTRRTFTGMDQLTTMRYSTANIVNVPDVPLQGIPHGGYVVG